MIGSDMGLGDAINADVKSQADRFGVKYTMWRVADHFQPRPRHGRPGDPRHGDRKLPRLMTDAPSFWTT